METVVRIGRLLTSAIGGFFVVCLGGMDQLMISLLVFMALDILTGLLISLFANKTSSKVMFVGVLKKVVELLVIVVTVRLDSLILSDLGFELHFREFFIVYVLLDELLSIVENACLLGIFPESFRTKFIQVKEEFVVSLGSAIMGIVLSIKDQLIALLVGKDSSDDKGEEDNDKPEE